MEKRIELEKRGRPVDEIVELNLDNCRATQVSGLTSEFVQLESLSLINVGLTTLKGFPSLPNLKKLELSDNRISNGLNQLHGCRKLHTINLSGNKIKDLETLEPLKELPELRILDLFNWEGTNIDNYREAIFELLKGLEYLDGYDRNDEEIDDDEDDSPEEDLDEENEGEPQEGASDQDDDDDVDGGDDDEDDDDDEEEDDPDLLNDTGAGDDDLDDDDDDDDLDDDDDDDDLDDDEDGDGEFGELDESNDLNGDENGDEDDEDEDEVANGVQHGVKRKHDDDDEYGD